LKGKGYFKTLKNFKKKKNIKYAILFSKLNLKILKKTKIQNQEIHINH